MSSESSEVVLAQEQGATMRDAGRRKEIEAEFGFDETEGTLILTNRRVIFACLDEREEDLPGQAGWNPTSKIRFVYSEIEDVDNISQEPPNVFVPITAISSIKGHREEIGRPSLQVEWADAGGKHALVFTQGLPARRGRNLNDWARVVENIKAGKQKLVLVPSPPSTESLDGKIVRVLSDMQEKGVLAIEDAVETEFKVDLDPDEVQAACDRLAAGGTLKRYPDPSGDVFYRRVSPLGEDDLSA
jgi:hypothetical protein